MTELQTRHDLPLQHVVAEDLLVATSSDCDVARGQSPRCPAMTQHPPSDWPVAQGGHRSCALSPRILSSTLDLFRECWRFPNKDPILSLCLRIVRDFMSLLPVEHARRADPNMWTSSAKAQGIKLVGRRDSCMGQFDNEIVPLLFKHIRTSVPGKEIQLTNGTRAL